MIDSMNAPSAEDLTESALADVVGGAGQPQHGSPSGFGFPTSITLPNGTVLQLRPPGQPPVIEVITAVAGFIR